jgi:hypothetical protein
MRSGDAEMSAHDGQGVYHVVAGGLEVLAIPER